MCKKKKEKLARQALAAFCPFLSPSQTTAVGHHHTMLSYSNSFLLLTCLLKPHWGRDGSLVSASCDHCRACHYGIMTRHHDVTLSCLHDIEIAVYHLHPQCLHRSHLSDKEPSDHYVTMLCSKQVIFISPCCGLAGEVAASVRVFMHARSREITGHKEIAAQYLVWIEETNWVSHCGLNQQMALE